jgi:hypothetical protein
MLVVRAKACARSDAERLAMEGRVMPAATW